MSIAYFEYHTIRQSRDFEDLKLQNLESVRRQEEEKEHILRYNFESASTNEVKHVRFCLAPPTRPALS